MKKKSPKLTSKSVLRTTIDLDQLKGVPYNPRKIDKEELEHLARSIATFGFVEDVVVRAETNEVIGGHQRLQALRGLLGGLYKDEKGDPLDFTLPDNKVPCVVVSGLSDQEAKLLNLSLNRISGEWDYDKLPHLLSELSVDIGLEGLLISGFSASEITDYVDTYTSTNTTDGTIPKPIGRAPKLTLDFGTCEQRDAFKTWLGKIQKVDEKEPIGCSLMRAVGLTQ